jgi:hypothetical protein
MLCSSRHSSLRHSSASQGIECVAQLCLPVQAQVHRAAWRSAMSRRAFPLWGLGSVLARCLRCRGSCSNAAGAGDPAAMQQVQGILQQCSRCRGSCSNAAMLAAVAADWCWWAAAVAASMIVVVSALLCNEISCWSWSWKHFPDALTYKARAALASQQARGICEEATAGHKQP